MRTLRPLLIASAAALAATAHSETSMPSSSTQVLGAPITGAGAGITEAAREFVENAGHAGHAELQAARLALARSSDAEIRLFAQRMIDDHTRLNDRLRKIARANRLQIPPGPSAVHKAKLDQLSAADGREFHRRYVDDFGVQAHSETIELFDKSAARMYDGDLKAFAREALPTLRQHLRMGQSLQARFDPSAVRGPAVVSPVADRAPATAPVATTDAARNNELRDALQEVNEAVQVVQLMKRDPDMAPLLQRAKGVFILTSYGRAGIGIGAQGGEGVLVTRQGERFSDPVFYNLAGISIGPQAGGAGGEIAMLLMTDGAVDRFKSGRRFSLQADAGLTFVDYSRRAQMSTGKVQDVVVWSATMGAYAGISAGVTYVNVDDAANRAYYGRDAVTPSQILSGSITNPHNNVLDLVLGA